MSAPPSSNSTHGSPDGQGAQGGHGGGAAGGAAGGHGAGNAAMYARFAKRLALNKRYMRIYAASLCGLIAIFIITHWIRLLVNRARRSSKSQTPSKLAAPFAYVSRCVYTGSSPNSGATADQSTELQEVFSSANSRALVQMVTSCWLRLMLASTLHSRLPELILPAVAP